MLKSSRSDSLQWKVALVAAIWVFAALLSASTALAARYVSPTGTDAGPNPCNDPNHKCRTIKWAVQQALDGGTVIVDAGNYVESIIVSKNLTIQGAGEAAFGYPLTQPNPTVVDGNKQDTVFKIESGVTATIQSMNIVNGKIGILNLGNLTGKKLVVAANGEGGDPFRSGINNAGTLYLEDSWLYENNGAGLINFGPSADLLEVLVVSNKEDGIDNEDKTSLKVRSSAILYNQKHGVVNKGTLFMRNVTISKNSGSGLLAYTDADLTYVTITENGSGIGGGVAAGLHSPTALSGGMRTQNAHTAAPALPIWMQVITSLPIPRAAIRPAVAVP